ncbi:23S rRNA (pseudouridine(1915)-N(3))-methyltransferase RlmH [Emcibacter nanhaiensis]|uniref:Ribosomal RNA large subunit methyltransferase H n=1 Tax=Emcibacter nanhaiensis TaxID=1505037 RepID=A0A501PMB0_9PROT|nr:23S rRNA (pseudouridine(1915)-N(3))-methyltransferase RlmH [Emcibacter nanhaiensis]TPD61639.1 23S rRNA (pseudouridine(1915)-N(3))-methyltransferase RlmH [Emcibacter nanhaiensis]
MQIRIIAVGRLKKGPELDLIETFVKRTPWPVSVTEVEEKRPIKGAERMAREADLLLAAIPDDAYVIALDERGKDMRSPQFAEILERLQDDGRQCVTFVIGGAEGYGPGVKERADRLLSFGKMTWPHMMVRLMLTEQIYRASTILAGHPYHKD